METPKIPTIEIPKVINVLTVQFGAMPKLLYEFPGDQSSIVPRVGEIIIDGQNNLWRVSHITHSYILDKTNIDGREVNLLRHGVIVSTSLIPE
jgi:hypothetical protein